MLTGLQTAETLGASVVDKVYILFSYHHEDGENIIGVYLDKTLAEKQAGMLHYTVKYGLDDLFVREYDIEDSGDKR